MRRFILAAISAALIVAPAMLAPAGAGAASGPGTAHAAAANWPILRLGSRGEDVRTIQYLLNSRGYSLSVDGSYGNSTTNAVKAFQQSSALAADGRVGAATWSKLVVPLRKGSRGIAVTALESQLRFHFGYRRVVVDRIFGPLTDTALRDFQSRHGLRVNGFADTLTWKLIVAF
jgi:peptidoglycan hydrolase-like protein with peptidoglycan-binding domain